MPPLVPVSGLVHSSLNTTAHWQSPSRLSTLVSELSRSIPACKSSAIRPVVSIAKFGTSPAKRIEPSYGLTSMPPDKRAEARQKEQLDTDARSMERNFTRDWKAGDVYAPHDLSAAEARKWRKRQTPTTDAFDALSMNPLDYYKVSPMVQIAANLLTFKPELLHHV